MLLAQLSKRVIPIRQRRKFRNDDAPAGCEDRREAAEEVLEVINVVDNEVGDSNIEALARGRELTLGVLGSRGRLETSTDERVPRSSSQRVLRPRHALALRCGLRRERLEHVGRHVDGVHAPEGWREQLGNKPGSAPDL
jgi:hypothetical protein